MTCAAERQFCITLGCIALTAFFLSHTAFVTISTYCCGGVLLICTGLLFWMRFRPRDEELLRSLKITYNCLLIILSCAVLLFVGGVATWYE